MAGNPTAGRFGAIYADLTSAGTQAVGTSTLTRLNSKNSWSFDQSPAFIDVTSFGDSSQTKVLGLANAVGDIKGNWDATGTLIYNLINSSVERGLMIFPDITNYPGSYISGKAYFGVQSGGEMSGAVTLDLHFEAGPTGMTWTHP